MKKNYNEFKEIKKMFKQERMQSLKKYIEYVKEVKELNYNMVSKLTKKQLEKGLSEQKKIVIEKERKETLKSIETFNTKMDRIAKVEKPLNFWISVEWKQNKTWGMNPTAEAHFNQKESCEYTIGKASGCGYDKLSAAIATALNQNDNILNLLFSEIEYNFRKGNKNIRECVGYGCGIYGFDGGVGYNCFQRIFNKLGAKTNIWRETKTSDFMEVTF